MTQIEQIKAEIEKRFNEYSTSILKHYDACIEAKALELGKILTIINSFPEEFVSEDLERASEEFAIRQGIELKPFAKKFFKAGADWQKEQDKETIELAEDHAMLAGMNKMSEMIRNKIEKRQEYLEEHNFHSMIEEYDNLLSML